MTVRDLYAIDKKMRTDPFIMTKEDEEVVDRFVTMVQSLRKTRTAEVRKE